VAGHSVETPERDVDEAAAFEPTAPWAPHALIERARVWAAFVGPGRLTGAIGALLVVAGVGWWLLRSPALPTEAALPSVTHAVDVSTSSSIGPAPPTSIPTSVVSDDVVVHVTGAVNQPGVYELATGRRVDDALAAAGGPRPDADANALNLAAPLIDGDRIEVPVLGQAGAAATATPDAGVTHAAVAEAATAVPEPVDLNVATASELEALPGIGPATATAIVEYRTQTGPFGSVDQLVEVRGIGPAKLAVIREFVTA